MENFSKRTTATLAAAFLLAVLGWGLTLEKMGQAAMPPCDHHVTFTTVGKA
jgi:preprotein translocase subunit SecG